MDFNTFLCRLEEVRDIGKIENGYSHIIYNVMYNHVLNSEYMLVDVSTYKRTYAGKPKNTQLLGENLCAVPDFVVTNKTNSLADIQRLGCIEVKFKDSEVNGARLNSEGNEIGYLAMYNNHVIYTNGWIWKYYDERRNGPIWTFDFTNSEECNKDRFDELIKELKQIKWGGNK